MDPKYEPILDQAISLLHQVNDAVQPNHPMSDTLVGEAQDLVNDIKQNRNPRDLENRTKSLQQQLMQAESQGEDIMNNERLNYFRNNYKQMQMSLRNLDSYN